MSAHPWADRGPRRTGAAVVTRGLLSAIFMVVVYYRAPLDRPLDFRILLWLGGGLIGLAAALAWQVRSIMRSDTPRLQAVEAVAIGLPFLLLLYASVYSVMSLDQPHSFTQELGRTDALYFTMTVFTTVGFGDITPATEVARIIVMTQMVVGLLTVGIVAKLLFGAVQVAVERRSATTARDG
jgi:voltage-gated potassium channel